ncbi:MAG: sigma-54 dependent transcriptional regulator [Smithellaceae bacterium]
MQATILIVDDQIKVYASLAQNFNHLGYQTLHAQTGADALAQCARQHIHVVLLDIMLGAENGITVLKDLFQCRPGMPVIMITGHASIETAVQSIKLGAFDYVTKPVNFNKLVTIVENAIKLSNLSEENRHLKNRLRDLSPRMITRHASMIELCQKARQLAVTNLPILITGENGTGKEIIADFIHLNSARNARKLLKINCAAFPESLLDNELCGHEKGAYTGAETLFRGVFERAHESSLFLDEIGDMPLTIQAKILRTLQNQEIRRIGAERTITVDVRFIAATNKDLSGLIERGQFREDLFYRLNTAIIHLPPLRERKEDIPLLVEHFLAEYAAMNSTEVKTISDRVLEAFLDYDWRGNIRELKNAVNYAAAIALRDVIGVEDLPPHFSPVKSAYTSDNIREDLEKTLIIKTLKTVNYNKKKAARVLNMSRSTLYSKLEKYGIATAQD